MVKEACQNHFKQNIDKVLSHLSQSGKIEDENIRSLIFGDYMDTESAVRIYDEVKDLKELTSTIDQLVLLNSSFIPLFRVLHFNFHEIL